MQLLLAMFLMQLMLAYQEIILSTIIMRNKTLKTYLVIALSRYKLMLIAP